MRLSLAVAVLLFSSYAWAQVSVREPATRAELVDGHTTISLAFSNEASTALDVRVRLRWLSPAGRMDGETLRDVTLAAGDSSIAVVHPLPGSGDPWFERLEYSISPTERNFTTFRPVVGILHFPNIASYAFTVAVLTAGFPRPGQPFEVRVLTMNPLTGQPVSGVTVEADDATGDGATAVTGPDGFALLHVKRDAGENGSIDVTAQIGDFTGTGESRALPSWTDDIHGYTDKPIYQPGQTMHVRILAVGGNGKVKAGEDYEIRIVDERGELVYTAKVQTSRFGIASTDWAIPESAGAGRYEIRLKTEQTEPSVLRTVNVRAYELPSFRVTATPDHTFYLADQKAQVEIRGEYLFGKPVKGGRVRVTAADDEEKDVTAGTLDAEGRFRATLETKADFAAYLKFEDQHYVAFLTDLSTNRTEQRKFDIRISREAIHIYAVRMENDGGGRRVYITTYSPDGTPLRSDVEVASGTTVMGKGKTNRFGLTRIELAGSGDTGDQLEIRAITTDGLRGRMELSFIERKPGLWLRTGRSLYRVGEAVTCTIGSSKREQQVLLMASNEGDDVIFMKSVRLTDGRAQVAIPYDKRFGRVVNIGVAAGIEREIPSRRAYFPGQSDLVVKATPAKSVYRPGDTANIQFQASAETALGIAVVDQSVLERAATDANFGRRSWFEGDNGKEPNLGGIMERDLLSLSPAKIDEDLQLAAEVLSSEFRTFSNEADDPLDDMQSAFTAAASTALAPVLQLLDQHYLRTLEYPRDDASLRRITGGLFGRVEDPWMQPFFARYSTAQGNAVLEVVSAGPDKIPGTADDFTALTVRRNWFAEYESLIRRALWTASDYPATSDGFMRLLEAAGIKFDALRDPWGTNMRVEVSYAQVWREIKIESAGADKLFGTADDFTVAEFRGSYFSATEAKIDRLLTSAPELPGTAEEFQALLARSGVDVDSLRDPWGHSYSLAVRDDQSFTNQVQLYTYTEFNGASEDRKQITPVKHTMRVLEIRSMGPDGLKGTYDDFAAATFLRVIRAPQAPEEAKSYATSPAVTLGVTGSIAGNVTDPSGAVVADTEVNLNDTYTTRTNDTGEFMFAGLPPGRYRLKCVARGFRVNVIEAIPVIADHVTRTYVKLQIGDVSESVNVEAEVPRMETMSASVAMAASVALSTPRVREYFPETLYWQPELITDRQGRASVRVKLADSVTTWHVAVIGSTLDGRIAEGSADVRAFQPFLVDLDVPGVLTAGDEISLPVPVRNYLESAQKVAVTAKVPPEMRQLETMRQPGVVAPSSSTNAVLTLRADAAVKAARVRVTAVGGWASDAVEKPVGIHPDGERKVLAVNSVVERGHAMPLPLTIATDAIAGSIQGAVKIYPSLLARILESVEVLLEKPHGCGEQTISSTYPNLLLLKALKEAGWADEQLSRRAMKNLSAGYQRLLRYQDAGGGFTYWAHGDTDVALTAYALTFLADADAFVAVDEDRVAQARQWLAKQDVKDPATNALRIRALARTPEEAAADLDLTLGALARKAAEFGDPYAMASYALAAIEANKPELAGPMVEQLGRLAQDERGAAYWALRTNTPYHGWGRSGQVETTALVVSALARWRKLGHGDAALDRLIDRGALFLLQSTDAGGGWATSQATAKALMALFDIWVHEDGGKSAEIEVRVNGVSGGKLSIPADKVGGPLVLDVSRLLKVGANEIAFAGLESRALQVQLTGAWYEPWAQKRKAKDLDMSVGYSALTARVNDAVSCDVVISRPSFRGYGMMIASVGLPPGAEVDRGVLEDLLHNGSGVDSYEVEPDHVTFYVWPRAADVKFRFGFRPRYAMKARAAESVLYDYYNPDERVVLVPPRFVVVQ